MSGSNRLLLSRLAAADLDDIADYIARDNPPRAASFVLELEAVCRSLITTPEIGRDRSDLAAALRMTSHGQYLVLYRYSRTERVVRIERVLHGARDWTKLL